MQKIIYKCDGRHPYYSQGVTTEDPVGEKWLYGDMYGNLALLTGRILAGYEFKSGHHHFCCTNCAMEFTEEKLFPADLVPAAKEESNG